MKKYNMATKKMKRHLSESSSDKESESYNHIPKYSDGVTWRNSYYKTIIIQKKKKTYYKISPIFVKENMQ